MTKHIIFFIHGMGNHDSTWHEDGLDTLSKAWAEFDNLKKWDLDERIEAIPIVYNYVFETWRQEMASDFDAFKSALLGPASNIATEDKGQLKKISKQLDKIGSWIGAEYVKLDEQWDYYFTGARSQYIWELALNSRQYDKQLISDCKKKNGSTLIGWELEKFCKDRSDVQLSTPPTGQWILMHPSAALEYTSTDEAGNSSTSAVAIVELIGYNKFAGKNGMPLRWPIGVSIISTISLDNNGDRFGYGAMLHLKNDFSIGVARRDFGGKKETTWLLSADLGKLLTMTTAAAQEKFKFLDR